MRIGMVFHSLNVPGGSASVFLSLALSLQEQGHEVDVFCFYFDQKRCFPELTKNLKIHAVKKINTSGESINNNSLLNRFVLGIDYYVNARKIYPLLQKYNFDLIYTAEACAYVPGLIYKKNNNVPVIWSVFDPLSLVDNKRPGLITHKYSWFRHILALHNIYDSRLIKKIDQVIVPTKKMKLQLDTFYHIQCIVFPTAGIRVNDMKQNNIRFAEKRLLEKSGFQKKNETILFSNGHFLPHRRYEDALEAIALLRGEKITLKYIISGSSSFDPTYYKKIKDLVHELRLEDTVILDNEFKTNKEIIGLYQFCDIFLFVSTEQTWGLAPFEAMACKKSVIISTGVGCTEVLTNKKNAIIVPEKSPKSIADGLRELLKDKKLYDLVAEGGYRKVMEEFTYRSITSKFPSFLKQ